MRGETEIIAFGGAMARELDRNSHKGHWGEMDDEEGVWQLLYHTLKAGLVVLGHWQVEDGGKLELCADVANHAMFLADNAEVLTAEAIADPTIAYSGEVDMEAAVSELRAWFDKHLAGSQSDGT
jgi:hypothetical protein